MTYIEFIKNILNTRGRFNCGNEYCERHHILPKSCGGTNDKENLIDLFPREHFIAHKLLAEENPKNFKLIFAYQCMSFASNEYQKKRYILTPEEYEEARIFASKGRKAFFSDKTNHPNYGKHLSEETKRKISEANKGNKYCLGREISEETRKKISEANKNPSKETRQKMSKAQKARNLKGGNNPRAKKVMRLLDDKIYECGKDAAIDNNINYSTFKNWVCKDKQFIYLENN